MPLATVIDNIRDPGARRRYDALNVMPSYIRMVEAAERTLQRALDASAAGWRPRGEELAAWQKLQRDTADAREKVRNAQSLAREAAEHAISRGTIEPRNVPTWIGSPSTAMAGLGLLIELIAIAAVISLGIVAISMSLALLASSIRNGSSAVNQAISSRFPQGVPAVPAVPPAPGMPAMPAMPPMPPLEEFDWSFGFGGVAAFLAITGVISYVVIKDAKRKKGK